MSLTQQRLKEVLHYCPDLGLFWWKVTPGENRATKARNTRFAGKLAGSNSNGYVSIRLDGKPYPAHRLAWLYMTGTMPENLIDHANMRPLDNAFDNLREATHSQNMANRRSKNSTGFKGVKLTEEGTYQARCGGRTDTVTLGRFSTPEAAHAAYVAEAERRYGSFARAA